MKTAFILKEMEYLKLIHVRNIHFIVFAIFGDKLAS